MNPSSYWEAVASAHRTSPEGTMTVRVSTKDGGELLVTGVTSIYKHDFLWLDRKTGGQIYIYCGDIVSVKVRSTGGKK